MLISDKSDYIDFVFTNDGSVGLYNNSINDVYHSKFGAKTEAEEKFIAPLNFYKNFSQKNDIKILDICFGIGYNTKAFLKKYLNSKCKSKLSIDILEYDKNLVLISPFVRDGLFDTNPEISYILCHAFINQIHENKINLLNIMSKNYKFIEPYYKTLIKKYKQLGYSYNLSGQNNSFLHNIYYHCISPRFKSRLKSSDINKFNIHCYFNDARQTIKHLTSMYDIIFLDAFTPSKLPTLWSLDFFIELYCLCSNNGLLITYSNSAAVRHAMTTAGFFVGKIFDTQNRHCGTIASKNSDLIEIPLDEFDLGLLKTNAGVYYRDFGLCNSPQSIIELHNKTREELKLESSSHYINNYKKGLKNVTQE